MGDCDGVSLLRRPWVCVGCTACRMLHLSKWFPETVSLVTTLLYRVHVISRNRNNTVSTTHGRIPRRNVFSLFFLLVQRFPSIKILTLENDFHKEISSCRHLRVIDRFARGCRRNVEMQREKNYQRDVKRNSRISDIVSREHS